LERADSTPDECDNIQNVDIDGIATQMTMCLQKRSPARAFTRHISQGVFLRAVEIKLFQK